MSCTGGRPDVSQLSWLIGVLSNDPESQKTNDPTAARWGSTDGSRIAGTHTEKPDVSELVQLQHAWRRHGVGHQASPTAVSRAVRDPNRQHHTRATETHVLWPLIAERK